MYPPRNKSTRLTCAGTGAFRAILSKSVIFFCNEPLADGQKRSCRAKMRTQTMRMLNDGKPFSVVLFRDAAGAPLMGVRDDEMKMVWVERDVVSKRIEGSSTLQLPHFPEHYGKWHTTSVGGVSATVRRLGILRAVSRARGPVVLFATHSDPTAVAAAVAGLATLGPQEVTDDFGTVTELTILQPEDLAYVAARVARTHAIPVLENPNINAQRPLGIERLDRITAKVTTDETMVEEDTYGLRRGCDNWNFSWLPQGWRPPVNWDEMVLNVREEPVDKLPQPLRQHVAKAMLDNGTYPPIGSLWSSQVCPPPLDNELAWDKPYPPPFPLRAIVDVPEDQRAKLVAGEYVDMRVDTTRALCCIESKFYETVDTAQLLRRHIPLRRYVSAQLSEAQSKQLIEVFYLLTVERVEDPTIRKALGLILYRYLLQRGYTARWLGPYRQDALHLGNGDQFRRFHRLAQYAPGKLPTETLNKLIGRDGTIQNKGSKGSRSKYHRGKKRYVPVKRMQRSEEDMQRMLE
jgi:hypothetical protein